MKRERPNHGALHCFEGVTHWQGSNLALPILLFSVFFIWLVLFPCAHYMSGIRYAWLYEMCGRIKYTVAALILLTFLKTAKQRNSHGGGSTNCFHRTPHRYSANTKASLSVFYPSLNLLDLYYGPVLHVAVPVWHPPRHFQTPTPPAAHVEPAKGFWCSHRIHCERKRSSQHAKTPRQEPIPLSPATPCSHARLPAPWWSCLPAFISPLLIPLEAGWRPNTLGA